MALDVDDIRDEIILEFGACAGRSRLTPAARKRLRKWFDDTVGEAIRKKKTDWSPKHAEYVTKHVCRIAQRARGLATKGNRGRIGATDVDRASKDVIGRAKKRQERMRKRLKLSREDAAKLEIMDVFCP